MSGRESEIVEAVRLLTDLNKPVDFIVNQLGITRAAVAGILKTGRLPAKQQTLFPESAETKNEKPESRVAPWVQALQK